MDFGSCGTGSKGSGSLSWRYGLHSAGRPTPSRKFANSLKGSYPEISCPVKSMSADRGILVTRIYILTSFEQLLGKKSLVV